MGFSENFKVSVPEGQSGNWRVERFTVSPEDEKFGRLRAIASSSSMGRFVPAGTYTRLMRGGTLVMSDTPDEIRDHLYAIMRAKGDCLVNGLGLGVVVNGMLQKPEVGSVTAVELSPDVLRLVGDYYKGLYGDRLILIQANALEYKPPRNTRYTVVWHDIWDYMCADNLEQMTHLHRRYGRHADWQGSWGRERIGRY